MKAENEVFELCKQVYEATGWENTEDGFFDGGEVMPFTDRIGAYIGASNFRCPLYTSDYLLEKLPKQYRQYWLRIEPIQFTENQIRWRAYYQEDETLAVGEYANESTPLQALLKLTIALHEEGLL